MCALRIELKIVRLGSKCLYPLNHLANPMWKFIKFLGNRQVAQWLRVHTILSKDQSLVLVIHVGELITAYTLPILALRDLMPSSGPQV